MSWSDSEVHKGTIYKAANFEWVKRTKGKPHGNKPNIKRGARKHTDNYTPIIRLLGLLAIAYNCFTLKHTFA